MEIFGQYQRQGAGLAIAVQQLIVARTQLPLRNLTAVSTKEMVAAVSIPSSLFAFFMLHVSSDKKPGRRLWRL